MDYEKLYRDTINNLQQMVNSGKITAEIARGICADFVPESEDERIRKEIIESMRHQMDRFSDAPNVLNKYEKWIAWLEKQGEHVNFRNKIQVGDKVTRNKDGVLVNLSQLKRIAKPAEEYNITGIGSKHAEGKLAEKIKELNDTLEKQGKQKPYGQRQECVDCQFNYAGECKGSCAMKRGEQKPTDKVEPKFKVGDIITNGKIIGKVDENENNKYHGWFGYDKDLSVHYADIPDIEDWHLWTIQDAKAGDVLCSESGWTCIFRALDNHTNTFSSYCFMDSDKWFCNTGCTCHTLDEQFIRAYNFKLHPATKEQRDTLMKAMANAGYTFDFDKKELKKIEQKPWSEEDEKMFEHIIAKATLHFSSINYLDEEEINFLKSLKDRVQPQSKQEWSEEDEQYLLVCKNALRKYQVTDKWDSNIISQWLDNKLKSLRPQSTWKPSEEQMDALRYVTNFDYGGYKAALVSLYEQLKKLKA